MNLEIPFGESQLAFSIPEGRLLAVASPNPISPCADATMEIRRALHHPIGAPLLRQAAQGKRRVVIAADDMTRQTPVETIIPALLEELNCGGVEDRQVTVLIALGTHRAMSAAEILAHFGEEVVRRVEVVNHAWWDAGQLVSLGSTIGGTPVSINRLALEADFLIGVGSIVPHHIPGFSGGAKIIQPGITGAETTGATHFLSTRAANSYLGQVENPVRAEIESIAARVGLNVVFNVVLDPHGGLVRAFYGDFVQAHRSGVAAAREVYGVCLPGKAEIVIAGSHPCDIEFWQAHKALYPAEMAVQQGGTIILVTPCPEGVSVTHSDMLNFTADGALEIERRIRDNDIKDVVSGALALAWAKVREYARVSVVSPALAQDAHRLGFTAFPTVESALADAFQRHGPDAKVTVLTHAPDTLPLMGDDDR
jgi:nickel-dependent lactate racemase